MATLLVNSIPKPTPVEVVTCAIVAEASGVELKVQAGLDAVAEPGRVSSSQIALKTLGDKVLLNPSSIYKYLAVAKGSDALYPLGTENDAPLARSTQMDIVLDLVESTLATQVAAAARSKSDSIDEKSPLGEALAQLNQQLESRKWKYFAGAISLADFVAFGCLRQLQPSALSKYSALSAWFAQLASNAQVQAGVTKAEAFAVAAPKDGGKAKNKEGNKEAKGQQQQKQPKGDKSSAGSSAASPSQSQPSSSSSSAGIAHPRLNIAPKVDVAWHPPIPLGHTVYSWKRRQGHPSQAQAGESAAPSEVKADAGAEGEKKKRTTNKAERKKYLQDLKAKGEQERTTKLKDAPKKERKVEVKKGPPKVPIPGKRNILITSALPYVNNVPHLGNIIGCVLSADVYARFCRLRGHNAIYICGTDEYGTATEVKAMEEKLTPKEICDKYFPIHKNCYEWFGCSFDHFGRTTNAFQQEIAQDIFKKLDKNGFLVEKSMEQLWCKVCQRYLADRFVAGQCPNEDCNSTDAKGDQCDKCGKPLDAINLVKPKCLICKQLDTLEKKTSKHLFLDLPNKTLNADLRKWFESSSSEEKGDWSKNAINVTKSWLDGGLEQRCITRDLKWGTPVPKKGFEDKVFYVWFDAPIGYLSITAEYCGADWKKWWLNPKEVELVQFMAKDNIPFHCIIFPATLIGTREPYTLLHHIGATEYLQYSGGRFSKSRGTGIFGDTIQGVNLPVEVVRYYLLANRPESQDTTWIWEDFQSKNNAELLNNLGNFCNRTLKFCKNNLEGKVPPLSKLAPEDTKFVDEVSEKIKKYIGLLEKVQIKEALKTAMEISAAGNQYFSSTEPFVLIKKQPERAYNVVHLSLNVVHWLATLLEPYMPTVSDSLFDQLNLTREEAPLANADKTGLELKVKAGHVIGEPDTLFRNLATNEIDGLRDKFGGEAKNEGAKFPLDLRCGRVTAVKDHPDKTIGHLLVLTVDCGEPAAPANTNGSTDIKDAPAPKKSETKGKKEKGENKGEKAKTEEKQKPHYGPREIVAGLKAHYRAEDIVGKTVIVVTNLKPAQFRKVESHGMVLTAVKEDQVALVTCDAKPGTQVIPNGAQVEPQPNFNVAKNLEPLQLKIANGGIAQFGNLKLEVNGKPVTVDKAFDGARLK